MMTNQPDQSPEHDARLCKLCIAARRVFLVAWVEFLAFCAISLAMGGNAMNGKFVHGQHYLGMNGRFTEVSPAVFEAMHFFEALSLLLFAIGFGAILLHNALPRCKSVPRRWGVW